MMLRQLVSTAALGLVFTMLGVRTMAGAEAMPKVGDAVTDFELGSGFFKGPKTTG